MINTARISVNIDANTKKNALSILNELGMDMTTAIDIYLKTLVRTGSIPFKLETQQAYILKELEESEQEAADPNTKWLSHEEMLTSIETIRKTKKNVLSD